MSRCLLFLLSAMVVSVMSVGCCGPRGCGVGCGISTCNDCDGIGYGEQVIPQRPFDRLRNGSLFCGSGCGEVYVDEWGSNPPKCDPCDGADFVGSGCSSCDASYCWQPGDLLNRVGWALLGNRNCTGTQSSADCGCGSCGGGGLLRGGLLGGRNCSGVESSTDCGCSDGSCGASGGSIEYAPPVEYSAPAASSSCGCSSTASVSPVGRSTHTASRLAPPKRDGITKHY